MGLRGPVVVLLSRKTMSGKGREWNGVFINKLHTIKLMNIVRVSGLLHAVLSGINPQVHFSCQSLPA